MTATVSFVGRKSYSEKKVDSDSDWEKDRINLRLLGPMLKSNNPARRSILLLVIILATMHKPNQFGRGGVGVARGAGCRQELHNMRSHYGLFTAALSCCRNKHYIINLPRCQLGQKEGLKSPT